MPAIQGSDDDVDFLVRQIIKIKEKRIGTPPGLVFIPPRRRPTRLLVCDSDSHFKLYVDFSAIFIKNTRNLYLTFLWRAKKSNKRNPPCNTVFLAPALSMAGSKTRWDFGKAVRQISITFSRIPFTRNTDTAQTICSLLPWKPPPLGCAAMGSSARYLHFNRLLTRAALKKTASTLRASSLVIKRESSPVIPAIFQPESRKYWMPDQACPGMFLSGGRHDGFSRPDADRLFWFFESKVRSGTDPTPIDPQLSKLFPADKGSKLFERRPGLWQKAINGFQ